MKNDFIFMLDDDMTAIEPYATIVCQTEEDYNDIQKAIEKQIAKKPKGKYTCPKCCGRICIQYYSEENEWTEWYVTFCPECGTKIDWSDYDG